jgi:hypothetical protein
MRGRMKIEVVIAYNTVIAVISPNCCCGGKRKENRREEGVRHCLL